MCGSVLTVIWIILGGHERAADADECQRLSARVMVYSGKHAEIGDLGHQLHHPLNPHYCFIRESSLLHALRSVNYPPEDSILRYLTYLFSRPGHSVVRL